MPSKARPCKMGHCPAYLTDVLILKFFLDPLAWKCNISRLLIMLACTSLQLLLPQVCACAVLAMTSFTLALVPVAILPVPAFSLSLLTAGYAS